MMANGMGFPVFVSKAHATTARHIEWGVSGGFDCFALSHGEKEQMAENHNNGWALPSLRGRGQSRLERRYPDFQKPSFKTDTDKRDGRAWMSDLVT